MPPKVRPMDTDEAQRTLRDALRNPHQSTTPAGNAVVAWVVGTFYLLIALIEALFGELRVPDLEDDVNTKLSVPVTKPQATTSAAATRPTRRCTKCHACGHVDSDCHTTDPATMRKRVATNQRRKKTARTHRTSPSQHHI